MNTFCFHVERVDNVGDSTSVIEEIHVSDKVHERVANIVIRI